MKNQKKKVCHSDIRDWIVKEYETMQPYEVKSFENSPNRDKIIQVVKELIDEGYKLEMSLMQYLPKCVNYDIWEEHWKDIITKYKEINIKHIRKLITNRCLNVLNQVITNNGLK